MHQPKAEYIDSSDKLQNLCSHLAKEPFFALDTEFLSEHSYYAKLCLLQVASNSKIAIIDPLLGLDLTPLWALCADGQIVKVMHSASNDVGVLHHVGCRFENIFDTQIGAALLGAAEQTALANLVMDYCQVQLSKSQSRSNWQKRPLSAAQLGYAGDDVRYLPQIYQQMRAQLQQLGRHTWHEQECAALGDIGRFNLEPLAAYQRIKGRALSRRKLLLLQHLAAWRERQAAAQNLPRRRICDDELLLDIAKAAPKNAREFSLVRAANHLNNQYKKELMAALEFAYTLPKSSWPEVKPPLDKTALQQMDFLQLFVKKRAGDIGTNMHVLANRHALELLLFCPEKTPLLQGWRKDVIGTDLQKCLQGEIQLQLCDGQLHIIRKNEF